MTNLTLPTPDSRGQQRPKRVITEARRSQNREAQRAYRQRQKERRQRQLQQNTVGTSRSTVPIQLLRPARAVSPTQDAATPQVLPELPSTTRNPDARTADEQLISLQEGFDLFSPLNLTGEVETICRDDCLLPLDTNFDLLGMQPFLTGNLEASSLESHTENNHNSPTSRSIESLPPLTEGILGITQNDSASENSTSGAGLPDPYSNRLQPEVTRTSLLKACMYNAHCLGISVDEFFGYSCMSLCSPFYRFVCPSDDPTALRATVSHPSIPAHLQPTLPQILFPHHPLFDLIPIPALRARAIMLAATLPNMVDIVDLKLDIVEGGLLYRGNREKGRNGGSGQPWDLRSWEAAPWFLKKWRFLLSGKDTGLEL